LPGGTLTNERGTDLEQTRNRPRTSPDRTRNEPGTNPAPARQGGLQRKERVRPSVSHGTGKNSERSANALGFV